MKKNKAGDRRNTLRENHIERRKAPRFNIHQDVLVQVKTTRFFNIIRPRVEDFGKLVNISSNGALVVYVDGKMRSHKPVHISITAPDHYFAVDDILAQTISDSKLSDLDGATMIRQRSFQFSRLSPRQARQLKMFTQKLSGSQ